MSEENGLMSHSTTSPHQDNQTVTGNKAMVITSPDLILCTLKGNWYNLILMLCKITLNPRSRSCSSCSFETACPASFATSEKEVLILHVSILSPLLQYSHKLNTRERTTNPVGTAATETLQWIGLFELVLDF